MVVPSSFAVAEEYPGTLDVVDGASLDSGSLIVGVREPSHGELTVDGANWTNARDAEVRYGELTILGESQVDIGQLFRIAPVGTVNLNGGTLRVGSFDNQGTFNWNSGSFEITGGQGLVVGGGGGPDVWNVASGQTLGITTDVQIGDGGVVHVAPGGAVEAGGTIHVDANGALQLSGGAASAARIELRGGLLEGVGLTAGTLSNAGRIEPGASPGILTHDGDFQQLPDGVLAFELASLSDFDALDISGHAELDGTLDVSLLGGFEPQRGDSFALLRAASLSGEFSAWNLPELGPELRWSIGYEADRVTLAVAPVPEPANVLYAVTALGLLVAARRRLAGR